MPIPTDEERCGTLVGGKYKLQSILGRGGMGVVYRATHTWTDRRVAVKILNAFFANNDEAVARFLREAKSAAALNHPNVVDVLDMGADDAHTVWIALEFLEGESLHDFLYRSGKLSAYQTAELLMPILMALEAAHAQGVIHRDIKPENIFLSINGAGQLVPKLLDFGIAKLVEQSTAGRGTRAGLLIGTPHYMSPEQAQGLPTITPAADIWSLGVLLYECLTGTLPFDGHEANEVLAAIFRGSYAPLDAEALGATPDIADVVAGALAPIESRYATVRQFAEALASAVALRHPWLDEAARRPSPAAIESVSVHSVQSTPPKEVSRPRRRSPAPHAEADRVSVSLPPEPAGTSKSKTGWVVAGVLAALLLLGGAVLGVQKLVRDSVSEAVRTTRASEPPARPAEPAIERPAEPPPAAPAPPVAERQVAAEPIVTAVEPPPEAVAAKRPPRPRAPAETPSASPGRSRPSTDLAREF